MAKKSDFWPEFVGKFVKISTTNFSTCSGDVVAVTGGFIVLRIQGELTLLRRSFVRTIEVDKTRKGWGRASVSEAS